MLSKALPWRSNSHGARSEFPVPAVLFYTLGLTPFFKLCNPHNTTRPPPTSTTSAAPGGPCKPSLDSWVFSDSQIAQKKCFAQSLASLVLPQNYFFVQSGRAARGCVSSAGASCLCPARPCLRRVGAVWRRGAASRRGRWCWPAVWWVLRRAVRALWSLGLVAWGCCGPGCRAAPLCGLRPALATLAPAA